MKVLRSSAVAMAIVVGVSSAHALEGQLGVLDLEANGGINPATGSPWEKGDHYRLVFVSSTFRDPTSSDIADYNAHVQSAAAGAGLGSVTWNAIASTATVDARDNTSSNPGVDGSGASIILIDGTTNIATNYADLWDGTINSRVDRTETNGEYTPPPTSPYGGYGAVWASTASDGTRYGAGLGGTSYDLGLAIATNSQWIRRSTTTATGPLGLYAMSELLAVTGPPDGTLLICR